MCEASATAENIRAAAPQPIPGTAVDPITLKPVDEVVATTLVDNVYDGLLSGQETITQAAAGGHGRYPARPLSQRRAAAGAYAAAEFQDRSRSLPTRRTAATLTMTGTLVTSVRAFVNLKPVLSGCPRCVRVAGAERRRGRSLPCSLRKIAVTKEVSN
jgi:hypothetical protein